MKDLRGEAAGPVPASSSECFELVLAIERYSDWYPEVIRQAEVTQRDGSGRPTRASATVHLGVGPVHRDFSLNMEVSAVPDRRVRLDRIPHEPSDPEELALAWEIEPGPATRLAIVLRARLDVPRLLPLQGVGESVAQGFLAAVQAELGRGAG